MSHEQEREFLCLPWVQSAELDGVYHNTLTWIKDKHGKGVGKTFVFNRLKGDSEQFASFIVHACNNYHLMLASLESYHDMLVCMKNGIDMPIEFVSKAESAVRKVVEAVNKIDNPASDEVMKEMIKDGLEQYLQQKD